MELMKDQPTAVGTKLSRILCRVCLSPKPPDKEEAEKKFISVFKKIDNHVISKAIEDLAGITCSKYDNYTEEICLKCGKDVITALATKNRCVKSDIALRQSLQQQNQSLFLNGVKIELVKCDPDLPVMDSEDDRTEATKQPGIPSGLSTNEQEWDFAFDLSDVSISDCPSDSSTKKSVSKSRKRPSKSSMEPLNVKRPTKPVRKSTKSQTRSIKSVASNDFSELKIPQNSKAMHYCCRCPDTFTEGDNLMNHFVQQHLEKIDSSIPLHPPDSSQIHQCQLCRKLFKNKKGVRRHRYQQHAAKKLKAPVEYKCDVCLRVYLCKKTKVECEAQHAGTLQRFKCPHPGCEVVLKNRGNFRNHIRLHDPNDQNVFTCEICGKISKKLINHQKHLQSHNDIRDFECHLCGKKLKYKFSMELHMRIHTGVRPYQCEICPNNYIHHTDLKRHEMSVHTGERPYKCQFAGCEKGFVKRSSLQSHEKAHDNVD